MSRVAMFLSCVAMFVFALGLSGCPSGGDSTAPAAGGGAHAGHDHGDDADHDHAHDDDADHGHAHDDHAGHDHDEDEHADETSASSETPEGLAELADEDRAAAVKQKICPVSGELLGSMGAPVKVTVKDREVFLCCAGCEGAITEDPDKYLAKLDE